MPDKWTLLKPVEDLREALGLKGTTLTLLRAMISFIHGDRIDPERDDGHICFASNASLARRTYVSVQTVERHIARLIDLGLITRRASGNGKRWARRNALGQVTVASGLSLLPLLTKHAEFLQQAVTQRDLQARIADLRAQCRLALADLQMQKSELASGLLERARKLLRRHVTADALTQLLDDISAEISGPAQTATPKLRDRHTETEGHKDSDSNPDKINKSNEVLISPDQMNRAFPKLCTMLRLERTQSACRQKMDDLALGLLPAKLWSQVQRDGPAAAFMVLGYVLQHQDRIKNPAAYVQRLLTKKSHGRFEWHRLIGPVTPTGFHRST